MSGHLTAVQVSELRDELERQVARLEKSMRLTEEASRPVELDQSAVGRLSRIDSIQNQSMSKGLLDRESVQLTQVREALQRLANATYGVCTGCGGAIPFERLFVVPETPACSHCAG